MLAIPTIVVVPIPTPIATLSVSTIEGPTTLTKNSSYTLPEDGSNGQFLKTNGSGVLSFDTVSTDLVADTSPQLGGDLAMVTILILLITIKQHLELVKI